jgi:hypothetical protein
MTFLLAMASLPLEESWLLDEYHTEDDGMGPFQFSPAVDDSVGECSYESASNDSVAECSYESASNDSVGECSYESASNDCIDDYIDPALNGLDNTQSSIDHVMVDNGQTSGAVSNALPLYPIAATRSSSS